MQAAWGGGGRQGGAAPSSAETGPRLPPFARCLPGGRGYARPPQTPLPGRRCSFIAYSRWWRHCENRGGRHGAILPPVKSTHGEGGSPGAKISRHGRGAKKWLNFKKTAAGHVEKKKNGTVNISETSRVARGRGPPAPCHGPATCPPNPAAPGGAKVRRPLHGQLTCVGEKVPPVFPILCS